MFVHMCHVSLGYELNDLVVAMARLTILFDFLLFIYGKRLRSCRDGQLLNTVSGKTSRRQFTSI